MFEKEDIIIYNLYDPFEEIAQMMKYALTLKGHNVTTSKNVKKNDIRLYVMFGNNVWDDNIPLPKRYIIFQLEQYPIKKWFTPKYFARMANAIQVWDYNLQNVEFLTNRGINAIHVPLGYTPAFDPHPDEELIPEAIDVLFLGLLRNNHREEVIGKIRSNGIQIKTGEKVYGEEKRLIIASTKIVLNIHYGPSAILEEARIIPLLSSGKIVISEGVKDKRYEEIYKEVVIFTHSTEELIEKIKEVLSLSPEDRKKLGKRNREWILNRSVDKLFPYDEIIDKFPFEIPYFNSEDEIPSNIEKALIGRDKHLGLKKFKVLRHYGYLSLIIKT